MPDRLLAALADDDRAAVLRWSRRLGLGPDGWQDAPGFRRLVELVAIVSVVDRLQAENPELSDRAAFYAAAELCGLEDDSERDTHPADTPRRRHCDWKRRAGRKPPAAARGDVVLSE